MVMDWEASHTYANKSWQQEQEDNADDEDNVQDDEDFYGDGTSEVKDSPGDLLRGLLKPNGEINAKQQQKSTQTVDQEKARREAEEKKKLENQRRTEELRAKLIAQRQNTPMNTRPGAARAEVPSQAQNGPKQATPATMKPTKQATLATTKPNKQVIQATTKPNEQVTQTTTVKKSPEKDPYGVDALLAEGKAVASEKPPVSSPHMTVSTSVTSNRSPAVKHPAPSPAVVTDRPPNDASAASQTQPQQPRQEVQRIPERDHEATPASAYYEDLALWLHVTGYHDVESRKAKLQTYKAIEAERRDLEEQAARIAARLQKLQEESQWSIDAIRRSAASTPATNHTAPPPPPQNLQLPSTPAAINGIKRARSPERLSSVKVPRTEGVELRIKGAGQLSPVNAHSGSARGRDSRYSDDERSGPFSNPASRDPSLERRQQQYYGRQADFRSASGYDGHGDNGAYRRSSYSAQPRPLVARGANGMAADDHYYRPREPLSRNGSYYDSSRRGSGIELLPDRGRGGVRGPRGGQYG